MTGQLDLDYRRLERLALRYRGGLIGTSSGKRLTNKHGTSLEFADYRPYLPGDDIRRVDWSLFGRSRRLYTKLNRSEVDATVNFLLDGSRSMDWGEPNKGIWAKKLTLALSYLSLRAYDRVAVGLGPKEVSAWLPPVHGRAAFGRVLSFLKNQDFAREGDLNYLLASFRPILRPLQLTVIISDFLSPGGFQEGITQLLRRRQQLLIFHLASPDELEPDFRGPVTLTDVETGQKKDVDVDPLLVHRYQQVVQEHVGQVRDFCRQREIPYFLVNTQDEPVDFLLTHGGKIFRTV